MDYIEDDFSYEVDLSECFDKMQKSFKEDEADGINGIIQMNILPDNDDKSNIEKWAVDIKDNKCEIYRQFTDKYDTLITMKKKDFLDIMRGKLDKMEAFTRKRIVVEGNFELSMAMALLFAESKPYDGWFGLLEKNIVKDKTKDVSANFRFSIVYDGKEEEETGFLVPEKITYRNVMINHGKCEVLPFDKHKTDVDFMIAESDFERMVKGDISYYDLFLLSKMDIKGNVEYAGQFPFYFEKKIFRNHEIKHLNVPNVFRNMHKMAGNISSDLTGKVFQFDFTGKERGTYFLKLTEDKVWVLSERGEEKVDVRIGMSDHTFYKLCCNEIDCITAFENGMINFKGDQRLGFALDSLFKYRIGKFE